MTYKKFPKRELIDQWDKLLKMNREEVVILEEEWKSIDQENRELYRKLYEEKINKIEEITKFLMANGIDPYKYKNLIKKNGYQPWYQKNIIDVISKKFPYYNSGIPTVHMVQKEVDGIKLSNNKSPTSLVELYDNITWQYNSRIKQKNKTNKLLIKSIEYATKHNINIEDLTTDQIIYVVDEHAKEKYLEENLPNGTEIYLKHACSECDTYTMGEHRCSCGNRRIDIVVEGNILEGFYYYPEPY